MPANTSFARLTLEDKAADDPDQDHDEEGKRPRRGRFSKSERFMRAVSRLRWRDLGKQRRNDARIWLYAG